jgi:hypothetical protein
VGVAVMSAEELITHRLSWSSRLGRKSLLDMMAPYVNRPFAQQPDGRTDFGEAGDGLSGEAIGPIASANKGEFKNLSRSRARRILKGNLYGFDLKLARHDVTDYVATHGPTARVSGKIRMRRKLRWREPFKPGRPRKHRKRVERE